MLSPEAAARVPELLTEAQVLAPEARAAFLAEACGGDNTLRAEIESLLQTGEQTESFLSGQALDLDDGDLIDDIAAGELQPGDVLGDCRIVSLLGVGGMGEVYLADDTTLGRRVAVKLVSSGRGGAMLRHFQHERKVLAALNHPHIARLYGSGVTPDGRAYLVMEYVEGERLDAYCDRHQLGVPARLALFRQVCAAVAYAHQNLVVHRDLKPANIRVTPEGDPKLLDFGIAKLLETADPLPGAEPTLTLAGAMTPEYASPEQLRGETITTATDVYSLGVVLYELLTGQRPYRLKSRRPDEIARAICEEEPPRPSTIVKKRRAASGKRQADHASPGSAADSGTSTFRLPPAAFPDTDLDNVVAVAMRKQAVRRYASVAQLSEDLRRYCAGLPVTARRDTLPYRAGKFVRRNRTLVAVAALLLLALVGGLVATAWQARVAKQERDRARLAQRQAERLNGFLQNLLGSADPKKMGKDVKVVQVLDAAGKSIDRELAGEPEILAQAHETLSRVYGQLRVVEPAEQHARAALAIERGLHGAGALETARAEYLLAGVLTARFQLAEAEPLVRHALAVERAQVPPDPYGTSKALLTLGQIFTSANRTAEAGPTLRESLALMRQARGERDPDYVHVLLIQANLRYAEKDLVGAAADFRRVIELYDQLSPHGLEAFAPAANLCVILFAQHQFVEMESVLSRLEQDTRQLLGENNLYSAIVLQLRSLLDFARGDYAKATPESRRGLEVVAAAYPADNLSVVQARAMLGLCLTRTGHAAEGEPFLRTALVDGAKIATWNFDDTFGNLPSALGECLFVQERFAEAEPLLVSGYDELKTRLGAPHPMTARAARRLHAFYVAWRKPEQAARFFE